MMEDITKDEEVILKVLKEEHCSDQHSSLAPKTLISKCKEKGIKQPESVERALVSLIDKDLVEYEMDDACNVTDIWLL